MSGALVQERFASASRELAAVTSIPEAKTVSDKAAALEVWARRAGLGRDAQYSAAEIRIMAERRAGELMVDLDRGYQGKAGASDYARALEECDVPQWQARLWQRLAKMPMKLLLLKIEEIKADDEGLTTKNVVRGAEAGGKRKYRSGEVTLKVRIDQHDFARVKRAAQKVGMEVDEFCEHALHLVLNDYDDEAAA